jgi:magnesium transporter
MTVETIVYDEEGVVVRDAESTEALRTARDDRGTTWVRAWNASTDELEAVAEAFGIHHLELEDVRTDGRPKVEEFPNHTFVLASAAALRRGETTFEDELSVDTVGLFVGDGWVVSLSTTVVDPVRRLWDAIDRGESRLRSQGADFAGYRILDGIVDGYYDVLDEIATDIEVVEDAVIESPDEETLEVITGIRRELLSIRRLLWPTRDATSVLARGDPDQIGGETEKYYRDVYDHLVELVDLTETYRDLAAGAREVYLNALSASTNEVMKTLTVVATIVLPLTLVVGVFGMNFAGGPYNMPELGWTYGYPATMLGMLGVAVVMIAYFRRSGWI